MKNEDLSRIREVAQAILDERAKFSGSKLGVLYDPLIASARLLDVHNNLAALVLRAMGLKVSSTNAQIIEQLFSEYTRLLEEDYF